MSPPAIVIHFHILKDSSFGFIPSSELIPVNQLALERVKKAFCNGIVYSGLAKLDQWLRWTGLGRRARSSNEEDDS